MKSGFLGNTLSDDEVMLESDIMSNFKFVLASGSPRRRELLEWMGCSFTTLSVDIDETPLDGETPENYVLRLALEKSAAAMNQDPGAQLFLAADTTVVFEGKILGKPADTLQAFEMLTDLRGKNHQVLTGIAFRNRDAGTVNSDVVVSDVPMRHYTDDEIHAYINTGDPMDKAGAYAIQNQDFHPVEAFSDCFANVMGLPLCHLACIFKDSIKQKNADIASICQLHLDYSCPIFEGICMEKSL